MQIARMVQAVVLMLIVAMAASCAVTKEYSSKLFSPGNKAVKDSTAVAYRFLDIDPADNDSANWVTTDIIMGRDTTGSTAALDNLAKTIPAGIKKDSVYQAKDTVVSSPVLVKNTQPVMEEPVAKTTPVNGTRNKKTRE